jgi:hypothetical protein
LFRAKGWSCDKDREERVKEGDEGMEIEVNSRGGTEMGEMMGTKMREKVGEERCNSKRRRPFSNT